MAILDDAWHGQGMARPAHPWDGWEMGLTMIALHHGMAYGRYGMIHVIGLSYYVSQNYLYTLLHLLEF
jgi:hypothetical protein